MSDDYHRLISDIEERANAVKLQRAKAEAQLEDAEARRDALIIQLEKYQIKPENIQTWLESEKAKIRAEIAECKKILNMD